MLENFSGHGAWYSQLTDVGGCQMGRELEFGA
jgi:hypothetical protein